MKTPGTHKLTEAIEGQIPPAPGATSHSPAEPKGHESTPHEVAEEARRAEELRHHGSLTRDQKLTEMGRAHETHG